MMLKSTLVNKLLIDYPFMNKKDVEKLIGIFFRSIISAVASGNRVEIRGFGSFFTRKYSERCGRNPKTGESMLIKPRSLVKFRSSSCLNKVLNGK